MAQNTVDATLENVLEERVTKLIEQAGLTRPSNRFFSTSQKAEEVNPASALNVALCWHAMTRAFMFTTIAGLGALSSKLATGDEPTRDVLGAVQTAYKVIGDDMANIAAEFEAVSPKGADGIHYVWWADTIIDPLTTELGADAAVSYTLPAGVAALIDNMERLGSEPLGAAVQLRVVEAIALDIAVAFRRVYSKVPMAGGLPFRKAGALDWVDSHIKAETSHAASVSDDETGMTLMVATADEQRDFLKMAEEYTLSWAKALDDFADELLANDLIPASVR